MQQHVCDKVSSLFPDCFLRVLACLSRLVVCTCAKNIKNDRVYTQMITSVKRRSFMGACLSLAKT